MKGEYTYRNLDLDINYLTNKPPSMKVLNNAIILPAKSNVEIPWGVGGVIDSEGNYVEESKLDDAFGGKYAFQENILEIEEDVICISIIPKHWGHILIDVLSKMWWITDAKYSGDIKIAFCGLEWNGRLEGVYKEVFDLLGIAQERMIHIQRPTRFKSVYLPSRTLGFEQQWHPAYKNVICRIVEEVNKRAIVLQLKPIDKIYFSREHFRDAQKKEIGEKEISDVFATNGFVILAPETLSLVEQIYYFNHCKDWVCLSGTLAHNIVFSNKNVQVTILNRTSAPNPPQLRIDQMMEITPIYIDVFEKVELNK